MKSLASLSINYHHYRVIMPDYSGRFILMSLHGFNYNVILHLNLSTTPICQLAQPEQYAFDLSSAWAIQPLFNFHGRRA